jgi:hypothetical protein
VDSSSSSDALAVFPDVTISGGSGRELATEGMTCVSWVEEDGLTMSAEGVGSFSGMGWISSLLLDAPTSSSSITTLIDSITIYVLFVKNPISTTVGGVPQEYPFITFVIKFSLILPVSKNITFTSKDTEVLDRGLLSSPYLIRSLVGFWPQVHFIVDVASNVDSFSPKVLS